MDGAIVDPASILTGPRRRARQWLPTAAVAAAILSLAVVGAVLLPAQLPLLGLAMLIALGFAMLPLLVARDGAAHVPAEPGIDWLLVAAALESEAPAAVTDRSGRLLCANDAYQRAFEALPSPARLALDAPDVDRVTAAMRDAWRDGAARLPEFAVNGRIYRVDLRLGGERQDHLFWRLKPARQFNPLDWLREVVSGAAGDRLGAAGVMAVLADGEGRLLAANAAFRRRALGRGDADVTGQELVSLLRTDRDGAIRFAEEALVGEPLRLVQVPLDDDGDVPTAAFFLLLDEEQGGPRGGMRGSATVHVHGLLSVLPLGLALADREGRFLFLNDAFRRAAGIALDADPSFPSDLVVEEDKATVADAVRRFAMGRAMPGDLAIRMKYRPDEPVALTIAGAKGLGDAAVLLSLKDNSEESKLKRQIAQATKMQAVGQLAGGVAHDFNNILTAIIGHCDLMMMRHNSGDSDYDDIQQIKHNSNRAAALTRQLLAFSRQQTLRPQVLQLPDVISEISNLLKRLLGETVTLVVKHGRNLGHVRADPGQLEQVIVNLAVNARDAMPEGGTLTLQTKAVSAGDVRKMGSEIMPVQDYTALIISDTGTGIPDDIIGNIFEPFFTTKEVGKGTGLGLSTVYGIVKQTDGFIFADSEVGRGTAFTIYLPVHRATAAERPRVLSPTKIETPGELWGTGTVLLVEDEAMVRAVATRALERQGYRVLTANNGEEALEVLDRTTAEGEVIDLLISDVVMPTMDGPTFVRHARDRFPNVPVLFMSGYAEEQLRRSIDLDRVAFLPKPFSVPQLGAAARDALATAKK